MGRAQVGTPGSVPLAARKARRAQPMLWLLFGIAVFAASTTNGSALVVELLSARAMEGIPIFLRVSFDHSELRQGSQDPDDVRIRTRRLTAKLVDAQGEQREVQLFAVGECAPTGKPAEGMQVPVVTNLCALGAQDWSSCAFEFSQIGIWVTDPEAQMQSAQIVINLKPPDERELRARALFQEASPREALLMLIDPKPEYQPPEAWRTLAMEYQDTVCGGYAAASLSVWDYRSYQDSIGRKSKLETLFRIVEEGVKKDERARAVEYLEKHREEWQELQNLKNDAASMVANLEGCSRLFEPGHPLRDRCLFYAALAHARDGELQRAQNIVKQVQRECSTSGVSQKWARLSQELNEIEEHKGSLQTEK